MRVAGIIQIFIVLCLALTWSVQELQAGPILTTVHKVALGVTAPGSGSSSLTVLRPGDLAPTKSRPSEASSEQSDAGPMDSLQGQISARAAVVVETNSGRVLFALNPDLPRQPASTIKVITGMIALNSLQCSQLVRASRRAVAMPRSKIYLREGRAYRAKHLINATLHRSANDAAVALAEKIAGNEATFARLMTSKVRSLGASNTVLKNASGLTAPGQRSTARDLALIFHRAMQNQEFAQRVGSVYSSVGPDQTIRSTNRALWQIDGAKGGKTGFTRAAQQTYVGKFKRGNDELVIALMGSDNLWGDVNHLVEFGFRQLGNGEMLARAQIDPNFTSRSPARDAAAMIVLNNVAKTSL